MPSLVVLAVVGALTGAALYETAVALGVISLGVVPGDGPPAEGAILLVGVVAALAGSGLAAAYAACPYPIPRALVGLLAPAGAAFLIARFYTHDPYYLPTLRRMSDDGLVSVSWVFLLAAAAVAAGLLTVVSRRAGMGLTAVLLPLSALTALAAGLGH